MSLKIRTHYYRDGSCLYCGILIPPLKNGKLAPNNTRVGLIASDLTGSVAYMVGEHDSNLLCEDMPQ